MEGAAAMTRSSPAPFVSDEFWSLPMELPSPTPPGTFTDSEKFLSPPATVPVHWPEDTIELNADCCAPVQLKLSL